MKLLIINNHDSFTFNLVDLIRKLNVPYDVLNVEDLKESTAEKYSHILISPGPDVPRAYPQLFSMLEKYYQQKSILGVCLGHQTLCEFFGGVQEDDFPCSLEITAFCDEGVVMAMQHKSLPIYGVQFHPESYMSDFGEQILRNWLTIPTTINQ